MRLQRVVAAVVLTDLRVPPSHRLEALRGNRRGSTASASMTSGACALSGLNAALWRLRLPTITKGETMTVLEPIHPGEHLSEMLSELGITQYRLAKTIGVPQVRIHDIVRCRRSITADTALRIGKALGMTPDYWLNLQRMYDLDMARATTDVSAIETLAEVSA